MKILYLSCHETLEADELYVLNKLGHEVFSVGHYTDINNPLHAAKNGKLDIKQDSSLLEQFKKSHDYEHIANRMKNVSANNVLSAYLFKINQEFAKQFDLVVIAHWEENLEINWESLKNKPVIMRYIGQPNGYWCRYAQNKNVTKIAYSHTEKHINRHYKFDAIVPPFVDVDYYSGWTGGTDVVLTINKWLKKRGEASAWAEYLQVTNGFNRVVCGFGNEDIEFAKTEVPSNELHEMRKSCGVYFSTCSKPGPFTYSFIEALSTGIPMVSIGPTIGSIKTENGIIPTFVAHEYIENGVNGFYSDNIRELRSFISTVLKDEKLAKQMGAAGRETAKKHFSIEASMKNWDRLIKGIM